MRISDWSSDVCSSDLYDLCRLYRYFEQRPGRAAARYRCAHHQSHQILPRESPFRSFCAECATGLDPAGADRRACAHVVGWLFKRRRSLFANDDIAGRSEEHTSELQSLMRISYAVFCLKKKNEHN